MNAIYDRDALIVSYAAAGLTIVEAAANMGLSRTQVYNRARKIGVVFRHGSTRPGPDTRAIAMRDAYLAGRTLQEIGTDHGMTRERVRQIITKYYGRLAADGGAAFRAVASRKARLAKLDAEALKKHGCTRQQLAVLRRMGRRLVAAGVSRERTPIGAFINQRRNSHTRGIGWEMNLWEWWTIWQKSGKWSRRGRERGQFVMCRKGDIGPYSADNVFIDLAVRNTSAASNRSGLPTGVRECGDAFKAFTVMKGKGTVLGRFDTPDEAHIAYLRSLHREAA